MRKRVGWQLDAVVSRHRDLSCIDDVDVRLDRLKLTFGELDFRTNGSDAQLLRGGAEQRPHLLALV